LKVESSRFGTLDVEDESIVTFPDGLFGFPDAGSFALVPHSDHSPFRWLQSLQKPGLAFLVIDPWLVKPDYSPVISEQDAQRIALTDDTLKVIYAVVTIPKGKPDEMTVNLVGPILINAETRQAEQVVVLNEAYRVDHLVRELAHEQTAENNCAA
jgi:flagellar assembly factor FliW